MSWTPGELDRLHRAPEVRVAGRRADGTLRRLITVWAVVVEGDLYLRSVRGADGAWYRGVQEGHVGRVDCGPESVGVTADVHFLDVPQGTPVHESIDTAYAAKYPAYPSAVEAITADTARATTMRVVKD